MTMTGHVEGTAATIGFSAAGSSQFPRCIEPAHWLECLDDGAREVIGASSGPGCHESGRTRSQPNVFWLAGSDGIWAASIHHDAAGEVSSWPVCSFGPLLQIVGPEHADA
jgi:hypothetical protein